MAESSQPIASKNVFSDAFDAFIDDRVGKMVAAGATAEQLSDPEIVAELRESFAKFAFEGMGPGTEFNYDTPIIAEGLRRIGLTDVVSASPAGPPRRMTLEEAGEIVGQLAGEIAESPQQLQQRIRSAGARDVLPKMTMAQTIAATKQVPAAVGTALKAIEGVPLVTQHGAKTLPNPFFDPRASADKQGYQQAVAYSMPGFEYPGVEGMTKKGVPHWLAEFVAEDILDPVSWVGGKPLALAAGGVAAAGTAVLTAKAGTKLLKWGYKVGADELLDFVAPVIRSMEDELARPMFKAIVDPEMAADLAKGSREVAESPAQKKVYDKFLGLLEKGRPGTVEGRLEADQKLVKIIKGALDNDMDDVANELIDTRISMATDPAELADVQSRFARAFGDKIDADVLKRTDMHEMFFNARTNTMEKMPAGLVGKFIRNPDEYTSGGKFARNAEGRLLSKLLGTDDADDAVGRFLDLKPVGQGRAFSEVAAGLEWARIHRPELLKDMYKRIPFFDKLMGLSPNAQKLAQTPVFKPYVFAASARAVERGAWMLRFHEAVGGGVYSSGDALTDILIGGNSLGLRLKRHSPLLGRARSMFSPGRLTDALKKGSVRDLNDRLVYATGGELHREAIDIRRSKDGLPALSREDSPELLALSANVRRLFDDLGKEAVKHGLVDPATLVDSYLPRLYNSMKQGVSIDDAILKIRKGDGPVSVEAQPFFSMIRKGENPEDLITDLPRMFDIYVQTLTKHKYLKPVVRDIIETISSRSSTMSVQNRLAALEFLHHQLGGTTTMESNIARGMQKSLPDLLALADDAPGLANYVTRLVNDEGPQAVEQATRWFASQVTDMMYTHFIGLKAGLPLRNLTQQALGVPMMGGSVKGWDHLLRGITRMRRDQGMYQQYLTRSRLWNWHNDFFEFADTEIGQIEREFPNLLSSRYKATVMSGYQLSDMQNRANVWAGGYDYAEDVIRKHVAGKKGNWRRSASGFTSEEKASLERLLQAGEFDRFKQQYADAVVNNSQWLYNRKNRPQWAQKGTLRGTLMVFMTWPMNYGAAMARYATASGRDGVTQIPANMAKAMANGLDYMLPTMMIGTALEYGGRGLGVGGMSDWLFPDLSEVPHGTQFKERMGHDREDKVLAPVPIKPVLLPFRMATGDEPLGGSLPILRAWTESAVAAREIVFSDADNTEKRARALQQAFQAVPLTPQGAQPFFQMVGEALGIEPDVAFREGIFEEVLGAIFQMRESEGLEADIRRSQALPKVPGEQDRYLLPVEGMR